MSWQGLAQNELECQIWSFLGKNPQFYWRNQNFCYPLPGHFGHKMILGAFLKKKVIKNFTIGASLSPWMRIGFHPKYCSALSLFLKFFSSFFCHLCSTPSKSCWPVCCFFLFLSILPHVLLFVIDCAVAIIIVLPFRVNCDWIISQVDSQEWFPLTPLGENKLEKKTILRQLRDNLRTTSGQLGGNLETILR